MLEVADVFRHAGPAYRAAHAARMLPSHLKVMRDIEGCRTAVFGGHVEECDHCGERRYSYHSCCNRHCPKCHGQRTLRWLESVRSRLLGCPYFLLTFTLPAELRRVARSHQKVVYSALLKAAGQALSKLTADPRYLGAKPGMMGVLHTWTRTMLYHPHAHFLVTAGGLTPDGRNWVETKNPAFLVPARALSVIFRAKVKHALDKHGLLGQIPAKAWRQKWVVHCQHAGRGQQVLDYLGRYVFRIAIANSRLDLFDGDRVTFHYRDNASGEIRHCVVTAEQFMARFLQHVLPRRFTKVRYYGLYSPSCRPQLDDARALLPTASQSPPAEDLPSESIQDNSESLEQDLCSSCKIGRMRILQIVSPTRGPPCLP